MTMDMLMVVFIVVGAVTLYAWSIYDAARFPEAASRGPV